MSSIRHRPTPSGGASWQVMFRLDGRQTSRTFDTEANAQQWRQLLDALGPARALDLLDQPLPAGTTTVAEHVLDHIEHLTGVTEGTRKTYRATVARDMDDIGGIPLAVFSRKAAADWVNRLAKSGLAGKSIANRHGLLSAAMNAAVLDGLIPANPCKGIRLPRTDTHEMVFLTRAEYAAIHEALPAHWRPLALTLVGTGLRLGEATALQVRDVNPANRSIRVHQAWKHTGNRQVELGPPKTRRGKRTVAMQPQVVAALTPLLARKGHELLFTNTRADRVSQPTFWRIWRRAVAVSGIEQAPRIHDLRHTFASWAIAANVSLPAIQRALGHESITTTVDRYGHLARADFDALADATAANLPAVAELEA